MTDKNEMTMTVAPSNQDSRWVALDIMNNIISEGKTPNEVADSAHKKTDNFFLMFMPIVGNTYIF